MGKLAVKQVPPDVAKGVRDVNDGVKKLDHPLYVVEERKGTGKATCRQCDKPIKEGERSLYFHYAPEDDNTWIRQRGSIHAEDCGGGENMYTKCPKCMKQVPRSEWKAHWTKERKKRAASQDEDFRKCERCDGGGLIYMDTQPCFDCKGTGILSRDQENTDVLGRPVMRVSPPKKKAVKKRAAAAEARTCAFCKGSGCEECKQSGLVTPANGGTTGKPPGSKWTPEEMHADAYDFNGLHHLVYQHGLSPDDVLEKCSDCKGKGKQTYTNEDGKKYRDECYGCGGTGRSFDDEYWRKMWHPDIHEEQGDALDHEHWYDYEKRSGKRLNPKKAAKGKGVWEARWSEMAEKGFTREQAEHVYAMLEDARAHKTNALAAHSRMMMNRYFPPPDGGIGTCPTCTGSGKNPDYHEEPEHFKLCPHCKGSGATNSDNCLACGGSGLNKTYPPKTPECPTCDGKGQVRTEPLDPGNPHLKSAQVRKKPGLDPTAQSGNSTSMPEDMGGNETTMGETADNGFTPRVDPASENKGQQIMTDDLDTEARKLQKGLKGLDQYAGSFAAVRHTMIARFKNMALDRTWMAEQEGQWRDYHKNKAGHDQQKGPAWDQYRSDVVQHGKDMHAWNEAQKGEDAYMNCPRCDGTGSDLGSRCRYCKGSGLTEHQPTRPPSAPSLPYPPSPPRTPYVDSASGMRFNQRLESIHMNELGKHYPPIEDKACHWCKGAGTRRKGWGDDPDKQEDCYTCKGSGRETVDDPRDRFESYLSNTKTKKQVAPLQGNTGVHEDAEHYHVKLHDTDILSFHKTKPEVSIDWGAGNHWNTMTTKQKTNQYLPPGWRVGNEETAPGVTSAVVTAGDHAYYMRQGITLNTDTGEALDPADRQKELLSCKECHRYREADEMVRHQARHDAYRAGYEKSKYRKCGDCNGTGGTQPWTTACPDCKGAGADRDGTWCDRCKATGITFHRGSTPEKTWQDGEYVTPNPDQCQRCNGEGQVEKRRPIGL